jgi:uncharacterized protein YutE (UPF0331/DUF86 family)
MTEALTRKLLACRQRLSRIRAALPARAEQVLEDERLEAFLSFHIFLLLQDAADLATHVVAGRGLGIPASQREAFDLLAAAGLIAKETAAAMGAAVGLRNRIAHNYGDVDPVRVVREAPRGLQAVEQLLAELASII